MKYWKCTVCKYVHTGKEPPEQCPVCKVGPEKFVQVELGRELTGEGAGTPPAATATGKADEVSHGFLTEQILRHHLHPMTVHVPNGVIPIAMALLLTALGLDLFGLAQAAFYNLIFVAVSMPVVWITGLVEWRRKYKGAWSGPFVTKIVSASVVTVVLGALIVWHLVDPDLMRTESPLRFGILALNFVLLTAAGVAGWVGGKLVFKD